MTLLTPLWMQAAEGDDPIPFSALNFRQLIDALVSEGVFGAGALKVSQRGAGANMSVDVAAGFAVIDGDDVDDQGAYLVISTAVENLAIPEPPGTGSRTHRVVAQLQDPLHNPTDWSDYQWEPMVLEDIGLGTPIEPDSAITLALVTVTSTDTSVEDGDQIADARVQAAFAGTSSTVTTLLDAPTNPINNGNTGVTLQNTDLKVTLVPAQKYFVKLVLLYSAGAGGDLKVGIAGPTGFGCDFACSGPVAGAGGSGSDSEHKLLNATPDTVTFGGIGEGNKVTATLEGHLYSGVGGDVTVQIAQGTANADDTVLHTLSLFEARPFV